MLMVSFPQCCCGCHRYIDAVVTQRPSENGEELGHVCHLDYKPLLYISTDLARSHVRPMYAITSALTRPERVAGSQTTFRPKSGMARSLHGTFPYDLRSRVWTFMDCFATCIIRTC